MGWPGSNNRTIARSRAAISPARWPPARQRTGCGPAGPRNPGTAARQGKTWRFAAQPGSERQESGSMGDGGGRSTRASAELKMLTISSASYRIVISANPGFGAARATHTGGRGASGAEKHSNDHGRATHLVETTTFPQAPDGGTVRSWDTELRERHRAAERAKALPRAGSSGKSSPA